MNVSERTPADAVLDAKKLNRISVLLTALILAVLLPLYAVCRPGGFPSFFSMPFYEIALFLIVFFALIALHELIHGTCYKILGKSDFRIFFDKKNMMPMCAAKSPMEIRAYRIAVCAPTVLLALPPLIFGFAAASPLVYLTGSLLLVCGIGDAAILWSIRKYAAGTLVQDHPSKPGCIVYP